MKQRKTLLPMPTPNKTFGDNSGEFIKKTNEDFDKTFSGPLEPGCGADAVDERADTDMSLAISAKRQADALERIANILEKQTGIAELLSDELRG